MTMPLDVETRKAIIRLAEQNAHYRIPARVVLAVQAGQSEEHIAKSLRITPNEVSQWTERYANEGLAILGDAFAIAESVDEAPPEIDIPEAPSVTTSEDDTEGDFEEETSIIEASSRPPRRQRTQRRSRDKQSQPRSERQQKPPPRQQRAHHRGPSSIDDAVLEGFEDLLDEVDPADVIAEMPVRQVLAVIETDTTPHEIVESPAIEPKIQAEPRPNPDLQISVGALAAAFNVDTDHARHISQLARELFDISAGVHRLPNHYRDLLHAGAMLHNIAFESDPSNHHLRGRDLILQYTLKDISHEERQILAVMTALHRSEINAQQEPSYLSLAPNLRSVAEVLAALLRMGIGLDYSHTQSSEIAEWHNAAGELVVVVTGAEADAKDVPRARQKSSLWNRLHNLAQIRFVTPNQLQVEQFTSHHFPRWPEMDATIGNISASNKLRAYYAERLDSLAERVRQNDAGVLLPLRREFQRLIGVWEWLLPGTKPRLIFQEDSQWLAQLIQEALNSAAVLDRLNGLLSETDPEHDDPQAVQGLKDLCEHYQHEAFVDFQNLRDALQNRRYLRWLKSAGSELKGVDSRPLFASEVAERAWAYLGELRIIMNYVKQAGWNANLETLLTIETADTFEEDLRLLTDLLIYTGSFLGAELEQVLEVLEPLLDYVQAWQRVETVAQIAATERLEARMQKFSALVFEAFATLMRERANEMRWDLAEMWEPLDTPMFRRALALTVAKP